jgi:hypothetical protein
MTLKTSSVFMAPRTASNDDPLGMESLDELNRGAEAVSLCTRGFILGSRSCVVRLEGDELVAEIVECNRTKRLVNSGRCVARPIGDSDGQRMFGLHTWISMILL